jgi:hypothetical protein
MTPAALFVIARGQIRAARGTSIRAVALSNASSGSCEVLASAATHCRCVQDSD